MIDDTMHRPPVEEPAFVPIVAHGQVHAPNIESYEFGLHSDVGKERTINEDSAFAMALARVAHLSAQPVGVFIIADGMGGHEAGEQASLAAVQACSETLLRQVVLPLTEAHDAAGASIPISEVMTYAFEAAHHRVVHEYPKGATTLTAVLLLGRRLYVGHAGDCRLYVMSGSTMRSVTRDHSVLSRLVELEHLEMEAEGDLASDPRRNVLYRAIGQTEDLEFDFFSERLASDEMLLLCSDGLWGAVPEETIRNIIIDAASPTTACRRLVDEANLRGGPDNITAIVIQPVSTLPDAGAATD